MKNKVKYLLVALLLSISMLFNMNYIKADSGFDSSYDSGGSWDSGSSWDSSSSWDYSSGSYGSSGSGTYVDMDYNFEGFWYVVGSAILLASSYFYMRKNKTNRRELYFSALFIFALILGNILYGQRVIFTAIILGYGLLVFVLVPFIIIFAAFGKKKPYSYKESTFDYFATGEKYKDLNTYELQQKLFNVYKDIQLAWAKNNIEPVRNILSDELFNTYQMQIDSMIQTNQRNEMKDIVFKKMVVTNDKIDNNFEELTVFMEVTCRDYIVQMKNGKETVIRGKEKYINDYIYQMTFVRNIKIKTPTCPNCGANLDNAISSICPSCKSVVIHETDHWVLTKKKMLEQKRY